MRDQIRQTVADVFGVPLDSVPADGTPETIPGWDSLHHFELMLELEMRSRRLPHRCTYTLVFNRGGELLIHLRTASKDLYPSHWDTTVGGVLAAGESFDDGAAREALEELGVAARPEPLFPFRYADARTVVQSMVYRIRHDGPKRHRQRLRPLDEFDRNGRFGAEGAIRLALRKPMRWRVGLDFERVVDTGVRPQATDRDYPIVNLPDGAQILPPDMGCLGAPLPISRLINDQHAARVRGRGRGLAKHREAALIERLGCPGRFR